jgi:hypothetical protein
MAGFFIAVLDDSSNSGSADEMAAIDVFNDMLRANGHWVMAAGIAGPDQATVIDARGDEPITIEGPYNDSPEFVSGFWLIEAADRETAINLATQGSAACNRRVEVRAFL